MLRQPGCGKKEFLLLTFCVAARCCRERSRERRDEGRRDDYRSSGRDRSSRDGDRDRERCAGGQRWRRAALLQRCPVGCAFMPGRGPVHRPAQPQLTHSLRPPPCLCSAPSRRRYSDYDRGSDRRRDDYDRDRDRGGDRDRKRSYGGYDREREDDRYAKRPREREHF